MIVIETPRLVLREIVEDDGAAMFALNADPEVVRYTGDGPFAAVDDARAFFHAYGAVYVRTGMGRLAMHLRPGVDDELRARGAVGFCGLKRHDAGDADGYEAGTVDVGYRLVRRLWGRGLATEAARACIAWGFAERGLERIVGRAHVDNLASHRVLEKCGMRNAGPVAFDGEPGVLYVIERISGCP